MTVEMLKGKIHRATVVQAELDYVGSITVDEELLVERCSKEQEKMGKEARAQRAISEYIVRKGLNE